MSYNYADYHHRQFNHHHTQPSVQLYHPAKTFQQPCNYYNGADPYTQSRYSTDGYHPWQTDFQPTSPHYSPAPQPRPLTCWDPPDLHGILDYNQQPPTGWPPDPQPPQSHSTALLQQPRKFINSGQQHGLPNNPDLMVRSFSPAQLVAVNDYNEKLRVYRLDQAALLARVTAWLEENTDDENITEENIDNTPTMVLSADVPKDIHDVPNSITDVAINTAVGVDVSDEVEQSEGSQEEFTPMLTKASISHQSLALDADAHKGNKDYLTPEVHVSNENIGIESTDSCDAKRERSFELENTKDKNDLMKENSVDDVHRSKYGDGIMYSNRGGKLITVGVDMSHPIELPKGAVFAPKQRPWSFDPGGDSSPRLLFATLFVVLWFPP